MSDADGVIDHILCNTPFIADPIDIALVHPHACKIIVTVIDNIVQNVLCSTAVIHYYHGSASQYAHQLRYEIIVLCRIVEVPIVCFDEYRQPGFA